MLIIRMINYLSLILELLNTIHSVQQISDEIHQYTKTKDYIVIPLAAFSNSTALS